MQRLSSKNRANSITLAVFAAIFVAGLVDLAQPLAGDQSLFMVGAEEMHRGAVLYRDFWDLKQPGIFDFYYVAGSLGGFTALAVHAAELVYMLAFAGTMAYALSRSATFASAARLAPFFAIVPYYVVAGTSEQLQVEALAGFPIFITAWLACEGTWRTGRTRYAAFAGAGVAAGCALVFKLLFAPLVLAIFVTAIASRNEAYRPSLRGMPGAFAAFIAGAAVPVLLTLATLAAGGALGITLDTWFAIPAQIVRTLPLQSVAILAEGMHWFVHGYAAAIVLALAAIAIFARSGKIDALARCLIVWMALAVVTVLVQRTSWWGYQWLLESVPTGIFAAAGCVTLAREPRKAANAFLLAVSALLALDPARTELRKFTVLATHRFALGARELEAYRDAVSSQYAGIASDAAFLPAGAEVYVIGNPMYYLATGRTQPLVLNGWSPELFVSQQRTELLGEFQRHAPPFVYVTVDGDGLGILQTRSPDFATFFASRYRIVRRGAAGTLWSARSMR